MQGLKLKVNRQKTALTTFTTTERNKTAILVTLKKRGVSLDQIREFVESQRCYWCGGPLRLKYYPHSDGIEIIGLGKMWIYGECKKCGSQLALWKLLRKTGNKTRVSRI